MEAFSDGVLAIVITIMVLELDVPDGEGLSALRPLLPSFLSYALSFVYIAIYWNNHHHMLQAARKIDGSVLWANMHLLFWLSLVPFTTGWMGENHFAALPTALYGVVLLMAAIAYTILERRLIAASGADSQLARAVGTDFKGKVSIILYLLAIAFAFVFRWVSDLLYLSAALLWLIPDRRIERSLREGEVPEKASRSTEQ